MKKYLSPFIILTSGYINMTVSQLGALGFNIDVSAWNDFWEACGDDILDIHEGFNPTDKTTWPDDFDINDPDTWNNLLDF